MRGLTGPITAGPITYELEGKQYLVLASADSLFAFTINEPVK